MIDEKYTHTVVEQTIRTNNIQLEIWDPSMKKQLHITADRNQTKQCTHFHLHTAYI